jgi:hypothetical protein
VESPFPGWGPLQIEPQLLKSIELNGPRIVCVELLDQPIINGFIFWLKCPKKTIPKTKDFSVILVEILWIASVMHAMLGRSDQNALQKAQFSHIAGMQEEPIHPMQKTDCKNHQGRETQEGRRDKVPPTE